MIINLIGKCRKDNMEKKKKSGGNAENPFASRIGTVGGQAVLEGVMMKSKDHYAVAVRLENGDISVTEDKFESVCKKHKILNIPILRGMINMVETMKLSMKTLSISAEAYGIDEEEEQSEFEKWIEKHFGKSIVKIVMAISSVLGVALGVLLFIYAPVLIGDWLARLFNCADSRVFKSVVEGFLKYAIFIGYLLLVSRMKDIRRTFEYHGAEHKSIFCYENGEELTVENVKKYKRFHPRCGTSFLVVMLFLSIIISMFIPGSVSRLARTLIKIALLLPFSVGLGYEFIMYAGKHDNTFTKIISQPGLWMQRITTKEPDASQIEVAIAALKTSLPDVFPGYKWEKPISDEDAVCDNTSDSASDASDSADTCVNCEGSDAKGDDMASGCDDAGDDKKSADNINDDAKSDLQ